MAATVRTECAGCGGQLWPVLHLGMSPLADSFPAQPSGTLPKYPLEMASCHSCGLCQLMDVVDDGELFGEDYGFFTGGSPALVRYYAKWAQDVLGEFTEQAQKLTVEIGSNDGTLLQNFVTAGCKVVPVEPATPPAKVAAQRGLNVWHAPFSLAEAEKIREETGPAGLVFGINVVAHTADPLDFLKGVRHLLSAEGVAIFEFQDLAHLVAGCQFDHVYHEHRFFFSAHSFAELAARAGLMCFRYLPTDGQGGSVRMYLRKGQHVWNGVQPGAMEHSTQLLSLQARADWARTRLTGILEAAASDGAVAGYAASAKSCTLMNFCKIGPDLLRYVEDTTPSKVGRYTPGTNVAICAPGQRREPDYYLVMAWNYLGHAMCQKSEWAAKGGQFIVPIPVPVVI